jgi:hypothetical protein
MWTDTPSVAGSRPISSQRDAIDRRARSTSSGIIASRLSSSANRAASRHVTFGPLPPMRNRGSCAPADLGSWIASSTDAILPGERRVAWTQHPADHLEVVGKDGQPLGCVRKPYP